MNDFKHPNLGVSELKRGSGPEDWPDIGATVKEARKAVGKYHVTLFWANKSEPDEFDVDDIGGYTPKLYIAEGLVMCIKENQ